MRVYGDVSIAGINFVGAAVVSGKPWFGSHIGGDFLKSASRTFTDDAPAARQAMTDFLDIVFIKPIPDEDRAAVLDGSLRVHPQVRENLLRRTVDFTPELAAFSKPALVTFGDADRVMLPAMARLIDESVPDSRLSVYDGVGHAPFMEAPARFNKELAAFARHCLDR
jgi:pimeloyl-ACP methyl ester carboxylesterase